MSAALDFLLAAEHNPPSFQQLLDYQNLFLTENYHPYGMVVTRACDTHLFYKDPNGDPSKEFTAIDGLACYGTANLGHLAPGPTKAYLDQGKLPSDDDRVRLRALKRGEEVPADIPAFGCDAISRGLINDKLAIAAKAVSLYTGYERSLFSSGGVESPEAAAKLAHRVGAEQKGIKDGEQIIIFSKGNFHGRTHFIIGGSDEDERKRGFGINPKNYRLVEFGNIDDLKRVLEKDGKNVCAFQTEIIQGESGIFSVKDEDYWQKAARLCAQNDVLLIADEIQSGCGRAGARFASDLYGIRPDVITMGKAISSGLIPVSLMLADNKYMKVFGPNSHGSTFGGYPMAAAVMAATIKALEEQNIAEQSRIKGEYFYNAMKPLLQRGAFSGLRKGGGLWIGVDIAIAGLNPSDFCKRLLVNESVYCKYADGKAIRIAPPLIINENELDEIVEAYYNTVYHFAPHLRPSTSAEHIPLVS